MRQNTSSSTVPFSHGIGHKKTPRYPQGRRSPLPSRVTAKWGGTSERGDFSLPAANEKEVRAVASTSLMAISADVNRPCPSRQRRSTRDSSHTQLLSPCIRCSSATTWTSSRSGREIARPTRHLRTEGRFCLRTLRKKDGVYFPSMCETHTVCHLRSSSIGYRKVRIRSRRSKGFGLRCLFTDASPASTSCIVAPGATTRYARV